MHSFTTYKKYMIAFPGNLNVIVSKNLLSKKIPNRKRLAKHFFVYPELMEDIKNNKYSYKQLPQIIKRYNEWKKTQL